MKNIIGIGVPVSTISEQGNKPDLRKVGKDIYEVLTVTGSHGYKQLARKQTVRIEPDKNYSPSEVAAALNLSYDAALRLMEKMKGVVEFWTAEAGIKRRKKKVRNRGKNLSGFLKKKAKG